MHYMAVNAVGILPTLAANSHLPFYEPNLQQISGRGVLHVWLEAAISMPAIPLIKHCLEVREGRGTAESAS
jgi:hypothetical protein